MTGQGLKNSVMFAIDGEDTYAALSLAHDKFTSHDQRLFIGYRHIPPQRGWQKALVPALLHPQWPKGQDQPQAGGNRTCPIGSLKHLIPRSEVLPAAPWPRCKSNTETYVAGNAAFAAQAFNITTGCKSHDGEPLRMLLDDLQGIDPDGTG